MNSINPKERDLYLFKAIDPSDGVVKELISAINNINRDDAFLVKKAALLNVVYTPAPINLYINSPGGSVYAMFALIDAIKKSAVPVHTINAGLAASAAGLVLMAGKHRACYENSTVMIHGVSGAAFGFTEDIKDKVSEMDRLQTKLINFIYTHSGISMPKLNEVVEYKKDWYVDATESLRHGIVDQII